MEMHTNYRVDLAMNQLRRIHKAPRHNWEWKEDAKKMQTALNKLSSSAKEAVGSIEIIADAISQLNKGIKDPPTCIVSLEDYMLMALRGVDVSNLRYFIVDEDGNQQLKGEIVPWKDAIQVYSETPGNDWDKMQAVNSLLNSSPDCGADGSTD